MEQFDEYVHVPAGSLGISAEDSPDLLDLHFQEPDEVPEGMLARWRGNSGIQSHHHHK